MYTQVSILLNPSDLDERIREGMAMSPAEFVSSTIMRICDPHPSSYGSDFSNLCVVMKFLPSTARTYVRLIADSPDDACFCLLVGVVENWIRDMGRCTECTAGFREGEGDDYACLCCLMKEYDSTGLPSAGVSSITFGRLDAFLHLALFIAWSDVICNNEKPPTDCLVDCLVGKYALPVIYYVAGWTIFSALKASTVAVDNRPLFFRFAARRTIDECVAKGMNLPTSLVERRTRRALVYCTWEYFYFICVIESIYLANLTLKMMMAYNDGDIVTKIKLGILSHNDTRNKILLLIGQ